MPIDCPPDPDDYEEVSLDDCDTFAAAFPDPQYDTSEVPLDDCEGFDERFPADQYEIEYVSLSNPPANPLENECVCCGCGCCKCLGYWTQLSWTLSGITGPFCTDINGTYTATNVGDCLWSVGGGPPEALPDAVFSCEPANPTRPWQLVIEGVKWLSIGDSFTCECGGVLYLTDDGGCGNVPATVTVTVGGTWESCGAEEPVCGAAAASPSGLPLTEKTIAPPSRTPVCRHLSDTTERIGHRDYYSCGGGYGTRIPLATTWTGPPDARDGKVTTCRGCSTPGVWRLGVECGPRCAGYVARSPA